MTESGKPVRLGIIGAGLFARQAHVPALRALGDAFQIVAVCSRTAESAGKLAALLDGPVDITQDPAALLARQDIEAVDIILPIGVHPAAISRALAAGKHVISEKPMAPDVATGRRLLAEYAAQIAARPGQVWMVAENYRYEEPFVRAAEIIAGGTIGRVLLADWAIHVAMTPDNPYYHTAWRRDESFPGGFLLDGGVHQMAALRLALGEVTSVTATMTRRRPDLPPADTLSAALLFEDGALASYSITYAGGAPWYGALQIVGERGALRIARNEALELTVGGETQTIPVRPFGGVDGELAAFAAAIRSGAPHRNSPVEGLRDVALLEALLRAAETGTRIAPARIA